MNGNSINIGVSGQTNGDPGIDDTGYINFVNEESSYVPAHESTLMWDNSEGLMFYHNGAWRTVEDNYNPSDIRLKENLEPIDNSLSKIRSLEGFSYNSVRDNKTERQLGLSAQEVKKVFPEAVKQFENGYYGLDYERLTPAMVEGIKELSSKNKHLEDKLNKLGQENQKLGNKISDLKEIVCKDHPGADICN